MSPEKIEGGVYGGVDELYREVILEHFKAPKNKGRLQNATTQADGNNPLCGDQISVTAQIEGDTIKNIHFDGHGCAISQSSASMMTQAIKGKTKAEAQAFTQLFKKVFGIEDPKQPQNKFKEDDLGDLEALSGVKKYPVRVKCAVLAWNTLLEALEEPQNDRRK